MLKTTKTQPATTPKANIYIKGKQKTEKQKKKIVRNARLLSNIKMVK